ncbi:MAG: hydroxysqualene dehydroxylase HpnE [Dehalococcoidia bacterium]|nr:hydroxysqualene dehydroxylase HpnE [Dehalococcoidia bacterium]
MGALDGAARQKRLRVEVRSPEGRNGGLAAAPLPAPLHLLPSFLRYPHLSLRDKLRAVPALLRIRRERDWGRAELRAVSFEEWLRRNGQSDRAIANFWDLIVVPALNDASRDISAAMAFMLFRTALLCDAHGADVGYARSGLSDLMGDPIERRLRERGAEVLLGRTVRRILVEDGAVTGVALADGGALTADWCVSALPPHALSALLPDDLRAAPPFDAAGTHAYSPIVNLHVWYDRPVADFEWAAFVDSPLQFVFNKTRIAALPGPGDYLTVSLSAAWEWWPLSKEELRERFTAELARALPRARDAAIQRFIVVKEQRATFRSLPGGAGNRLPARTPLPNLLLAGDWTDTGWPATMEGAVRSGNAAAAIIVAAR